jgi:hypothetical protein
MKIYRLATLVTLDLRWTVSSKQIRTSCFLSNGPLCTSQVATRVARWFVFKPKIPLWVNFGGPYNGKCWYILWSFGIFNGHLVYFMVI